MLSRLYVFLQGLLIGLIAFPFTTPVFHLSALGLFDAGLIVMGMAVSAMNAKTLTIMPEPRAGASLVTHGIYRFVRHPMYLAVLLCTAGACLAYGSSWKWAGAGALACVLLLKARREESMLLQRYPSYAQYRRRTKAIIPFLV